jgi:ankyrin repeat protein
VTPRLKVRWPHHKVECQAKMKGRETAKEQGSGSGSGSGFVGSIMAALLSVCPPTPQMQRYEDCDMFNATLENHCEELQKILYQLGLDVDWASPDTGATAAHAATQEGNDKCLSMLIDHGANMSKVDDKGWAPIHAASKNGGYACIEVLVDAGADLNLRMATERGHTPVMICCQNGHVDCLALFSDNGADLCKTNKEGSTPAHAASRNGNLKCLQLLGERGADLNKKDADGRTPLDVAKAFKHRECIDLLIASGASEASMIAVKVCIAAIIYC